jgi:NTP pyrophosphatase (non-canonical NTP hydrolase)
MSMPDPAAATSQPVKTIADLQQTIDGWIGQFEEGYWPPLANLARLTEEVGELSREINHAHGPKKKRGDQQDRVAAELSDVVIAAATLANSLGIDLTVSLNATLAALTKRDADRWVRKAESPAGSSNDAEPTNNGTP